MNARRTDGRLLGRPRGGKGCDQLAGDTISARPGLIFAIDLDKYPRPYQRRGAALALLPTASALATVRLAPVSNLHRRSIFGLANQIGAAGCG
jgi:hypothetical protein